MLNKLFGFNPKETTVKTEIMAGITTFLYSNGLQFYFKKGAFFLSKKFVDLENSRTFAVG